MTTIETKIAQAEALLAELRAILSGPKVEQPQAPSAEPAAYCITKGQPPITDHALVVAASKRQADRIDELEAEVAGWKAFRENIIAEHTRIADELRAKLAAAEKDAGKVPEGYMVVKREPVAWVRYQVGGLPTFVPVINGKTTFNCSAIEALEYEPLYAITQAGELKGE